jgi:hypothetical protein
VSPSSETPCHPSNTAAPWGVQPRGIGAARSAGMGTAIGFRLPTNQSAGGGRKEAPARARGLDETAHARTSRRLLPPASPPATASGEVSVHGARVRGVVGCCRWPGRRRSGIQSSVVVPRFIGSPTVPGATRDVLPLFHPATAEHPERAEEPHTRLAPRWLSTANACRTPRRP